MNHENRLDGKTILMFLDRGYSICYELNISSDLTKFIFLSDEQVLSLVADLKIDQGHKLFYAEVSHQSKIISIG